MNRIQDWLNRPSVYPRTRPSASAPSTGIDWYTGLPIWKQQDYQRWLSEWPSTHRGKQAPPWNERGTYDMYQRDKWEIPEKLLILPSAPPRSPTLSNYPRLPQSTIPTPTVEYPAPGRPPGPSKPGYTNPFAWRRKNNGWW